ncbi:MAG: transcriptional repressor [Eubacteriales bacterium]|nr:transcriptional repressor [Eubacteriales bacterium]MDY3333001.1 transcriptional repressor [Gallibacter sp.]
MPNRNTVQKQLIRDILIANQYKHLSADEIYDLAREQKPTISKGTIYRNLNMLVRNDEISEIENPDGSNKYEIMKNPHYHCYCTECGKIFDSKLQINTEWEKTLDVDEGFLLNKYELRLFGICKDCQKKKKYNNV